MANKRQKKSTPNEEEKFQEDRNKLEMLKRLEKNGSRNEILKT